jgi:hypothetical protein
VIQGALGAADDARASAAWLSTESAARTRLGFQFQSHGGEVKLECSALLKHIHAEIPDVRPGTATHQNVGVAQNRMDSSNFQCEIALSPSWTDTTKEAMSR